MAKIVLKVETSTGSASAGLPVSFTLLERKFMVSELMDSWHGVDHAYFKLVADDGNLYVIRHDLERDEWEIVLTETVSPARMR